jgi:hypothetical protein
MAIEEREVNGLFPAVFIRKHGNISTGPVTATIDTTTALVVRAEMACEGYLDCEHIVIDDPSVLAIFVVRPWGVGIDLTAVDRAHKYFKLVAAGPLPDEDKEEDDDENMEMVMAAWKTCKLEWADDELMVAMEEHTRRRKAAGTDRPLEDARERTISTATTHETSEERAERKDKPATTTTPRSLRVSTNRLPLRIGHQAIPKLKTLNISWRSAITTVLPSLRALKNKLFLKTEHQTVFKLKTLNTR